MFIWIAVIIIIILICVYQYKEPERRRARVDKLISESNGTFDEKAQEAFDELSRVKNPTYYDRFQRGRILQHNVLEDDFYGSAEVTNIVDDYIETINDLHTTNAADSEYVLDQIEMFADTINAQPYVDTAEDNIAEIIAALNNTIMDVTPTIRANTQNERLAVVNNSTDTKTKVADNYLANAVTFTSDAQNVHDSSVNADLKETLRRIKRNNGNINVQNVLNDISRYLTTFGGGKKQKNALQIFEKMSENNYIGTFNDTEANILAHIWQRTNHRANRENRELMKDAVCEALADGIENNSPVCINGRTARVINSLVTLDFDDEVANGAMTLEAYKNQIYRETTEIFDKELEKAAASPRLGIVNDYYNGADITLDKDIEEEFKTGVKAAIDKNLENYVEKLSVKNMAQIKSDCYIYINI